MYSLLKYDPLIFLITYGQNGQPNYYLEVQNTNIYVAYKWQGFYLK